MKKSNATALTAALFAAALNFIPDNGISADAASANNNETSFDPAVMVSQDLYGPPSVFTKPADEPTYGPSTELMVALYGPPSFFTLPAVQDDPETTTTTATGYQSFTKTDLHAQPLYGPPSVIFTIPTGVFTPETTTTTADGIPSFILTDIKEQPMYGPPVYIRTDPFFERPTTTQTTTKANTVTTPVTDFEDRVLAEYRSFGAIYGPMPYTGDLNGDQVVNTFDLILARQAVVTPPTSTFQYVWHGDLNGDGVYSIADVLLLNKYLAGNEKAVQEAREETWKKYAEEPVTEPATEPATTMPTYAALYGPPSMFER